MRSYDDYAQLLKTLRFGRADTLFSAVRQYAYALPSARVLSRIQVGRLLAPALTVSGWVGHLSQG